MLTKVQRKALDFLTARERTGVGPSYEEIAEHIGVRSKSGVHRIMRALEERGFIRNRAHHARAIEVIRTGYKHVCPRCKGVGHIDDAPTDKRVA